jgi:hypothetical protein
MAAEAQEALFRVVAAVMHLGNLEFEPLDIAVSANVLQPYNDALQLLPAEILMLLLLLAYLWPCDCVILHGSLHASNMHLICT